MDELLTFISAELGIIIFLVAIGLIFKWLYIRSAIKSGVESAIKYTLENLEISDEFWNEIHNHLKNE